MTISFRVLGAVLPLLLLSACTYGPGMVYPDGGYATSVGGWSTTEVVPVGYGAGYPYGYDYGAVPYRRWGSPFGVWGPGAAWGAGGAWGARRVCCSRCGYSPCRCGGSHRDGSHSHSHSGRSSSSSDRKYRIIAGDLDGKKKPNDFHSLDWYHDRGYSLENLKIETDRGAVIDKRPSSQRSSSSSSSSSRRSSSDSRSARSSGSSSGSSSSKSKSSGSGSSSGSLRDAVRAGLNKR